MKPPRWLHRHAVLLLHDESLAEFGGMPGLLDEGLLDSALARPQQRLAYGTPDLPELAAAYGFGLAKNHPFVDGNKRTAFLSVGLFLALNGRPLNASQTDATLTMLRLAAGELTEAQFAQWVAAHSAAARRSRA
jgi:death-on-curing protein